MFDNPWLPPSPPAKPSFFSKWMFLSAVLCLVFWGVAVVGIWEIVFALSH